MNLPDQIQSLIKAGAWIQIYVNGQPAAKIALGAAAWCDGHGLLVAEIGAEHQGHVHLIEAARLEMDGPEMVDAYDIGGRLIATVHGMSAEEVAEHGVAAWHRRIGEGTGSGGAWRRFWTQQIAQAGQSPG